MSHCKNMTLRLTNIFLFSWCKPSCTGTKITMPLSRRFSSRVRNSVPSMRFGSWTSPMCSSWKIIGTEMPLDIMSLLSVVRWTIYSVSPLSFSLTCASAILWQVRTRTLRNWWSASREKKSVSPSRSLQSKCTISVSWTWSLELSTVPRVTTTLVFRELSSLLSPCRRNSVPTRGSTPSAA